MLAQVQSSRFYVWCKPGSKKRQACAGLVFATSQRSAAARAGMELHSDIAEVLFSEQDIKGRVIEMGKQLASEYQKKQPLVLGVKSFAMPRTGMVLGRFTKTWVLLSQVLSGSFIFMAGTPMFMLSAD